MPLDWDALILLLRWQFANRSYSVTDHADDRCAERSISIADIENCIMTGAILEEQAWGPDPKVLVKGDKEDGGPFYIIVAIAKDKPWVVTVCSIDENVWEVVNGLIRRK